MLTLPPVEQVRSGKRDITRSTRELEREVVKLRAEEKKLVKDIKVAASKGDQITVKTLAKSLVRLRQQVGKLTASEALMRGVGTNLTVRPAAET